MLAAKQLDLGHPWPQPFEPLLEWHSPWLPELPPQEQVREEEESVDLLPLARLLVAGPLLGDEEAELLDQVADPRPLPLPDATELEPELHHHQAQLGEEVSVSKLQREERNHWRPDPFYTKLAPLGVQRHREPLLRLLLSPQLPN